MAPFPVDGSPLGLTLFGSTVYLWWGPDVKGNDCVATANGLARTWSTADAAASRADEGRSTGTSGEPGRATVVMDLTPAHDWLRKARVRPDIAASLNLWNIAADIAYSTGDQWADRGRSRDACYAKLVAANVPWLFDRDSYAPRWSARELNTLRDVLGHAIHVLRTRVNWDDGLKDKGGQLAREGSRSRLHGHSPTTRSGPQEMLHMAARHRPFQTHGTRRR